MQDAAPRTRSHTLLALAAILAVAVAIRFALTPLYAYLPNNYLDEGFWKDWMRTIHEHGVLNIFRASDTDYVGYHWVLWAMSEVYAVAGGPYTQTTPSLHVLVKMPSIIFDALLIVAVYASTASLARAEGRRNGERLALVAAAVIALQPAVVYDSAVWAQTDAAVTLAMLVSVVCVANGMPVAGFSAWTLGFLVKPHPIIVLPILVVLALRGWGPRALVEGMVAIVVVTAIVLGPWILHGDGIRIARTYQALFDADYGRLSASAWNIWWFRDVAAHPSPDARIFAALPVTYRTIGALLSATSALLACAVAWRAPTFRVGLLAAAYLAFAFYELPISTHERYGYPFLVLLLPVALLDRRWLWLYVPASLAFFVNMVVVAPPIHSLSDRWIESPFSLAVAAANAAMFAAFTLVMCARLRSVARETAESMPASALERVSV
ncbi:MAG TPA: hypothetical protein VIH21_10650 [Dehalococcoidia bacterium]